MARKKAYAYDYRTIQNAAQTLLANIRLSSVDNPVHSIAVTSSIPNEGKTTVSIELARAAARGGYTVLLVECDMRRHSLVSELGMRSLRGLQSVLMGERSLEDCAIAVEGNLWLLDAESEAPSPPDTISSKAFQRFAQEARDRFDFVIYDTPPVTLFVDAVVLSTVVDGTVLVVREGFTKRSEVKDACERLENAEAHVVGVCLNYCSDQYNGYYHSYYGDEGKGRGAADDAWMDRGLGRERQALPEPGAAAQRRNASQAAADEPAASAAAADEPAASAAATDEPAASEPATSEPAVAEPVAVESPTTSRFQAVPFQDQVEPLPTLSTYTPMAMPVSAPTSASMNMPVNRTQPSYRRSHYADPPKGRKKKR